MRIRAVAVYCGAGKPNDPQLLEVARGFGARCAERKVRVVYGGTHVGLMGAVADGALAAGGEVVGVLPDLLSEREIGHTGLTELVLTKSLHERKATMLARADACVALPGGIGTLDELFEAWTWRYLGIHDKPVGVLDALGFYGGLVSFLESVERAGLLARTTNQMLIVRREAGELLDALEQAT
jgi:uncharacterized protein (TIGR00730 family)